MKRFSLVLVLFLLFFSASYGQTVPQGMKYQAVARNLAGAVISNQEIALKVTLLTKGGAGATYYTEVHNVTTNQLGLFSLVIGDGKVENGSFKTIPWSTDDVWMQVAIKDKGKSDFALISSSKLLAVPYAFHAGTASQLVSNSRELVGSYATASTNGTPPANTSNGNSWNAGGNIGTDPVVNYLGTADNVAFIIRTNAIDRLKIAADGNIDIRRSLSIGANLNVDSSVNLNRTTGSTLNNGPFTVGTLARRSPTFLFGTLTVDSAQATKLGGTLTVDRETILNRSLTVNGPTDLNSRLNVNQKSPTTLTGTLNVKGITDLDSALNVNGKNPTVLTGRLRVDSNTVFNSPTNSDTSLASPNGALAIHGGVGIAKNTTIGGDVRIAGKTTLAGPLRITDPTPSTSTTTGALTVAGGVGIGGQLNVGDTTNLSKSLNVSGVTALKNTTQSTNTTTGALVVSGGAGIASNVNIGGTLTATGVTNLNSQVTINANVSGGESDRNGYPLKVEGSGQGIAVKINGSRSTGNNFISFWDDNGMQGRIEGQTPEQMLENDDYKFEKRQYEGDIAFGTIDLLLATYDEIKALSDLFAAVTSSTPCVGLGVCITTPIPSMVGTTAVTAAVATANLITTIAALTFTGVNFDMWKTAKANSNGITYESGAGDYAEYLMREQTAEQFVAGDIVGVKGGKISKNTKGADKMMVISSKPIVLGNMPSPENIKNYEKVAFLGQVPVKVFGVVNVGDYILANGNNNGVGVAVAQEKITSKDVRNIVGIAWSASNQPVSIANINVAVGLNVNDNQKFVEDLEKQIVDLKNEISGTNAQLEKLVPGFKASASTAGSMVSADKSATASPSNNNKNVPAGFTAVPGEENIRYYKVTREDFMKGVEIAQKNVTDNGGDLSTHPFWKKFNNDPSFKEETISKIMKKLDNGIAQMKNVNKSAK